MAPMVYRISKRERVLLLILAVIILAALFYQFVLIPQEKAIEKLKEEKADFELERETIQEILSKENSLDKEWKDVKKAYDTEIAKYNLGMDQPELIRMLNSITDSSKIKISGVSFKEPEAMDMEDVDASISEVTFEYKGGYSDLENLLSQLRNNPKKFLIDQLSLNRDKEDVLSGKLALNAISYANAGKDKNGYFYNTEYENQGKEDPFKAYEGYKEISVTDNTDDDDIKADDGYNMDSNEKNEERRTVLADLESDNIYYMGTSSEVTGKVERFGNAKHGKTSVRAEYFISTGYQPEKAYVVLDDQNISIKYPPSSIGIWAFSYGYSPVTVGLRFQDMDGEKIDLDLEKGVNWIGWKYISATPPQDINIYPLKLDRVYMELGADRNDYGVLLFDRIEAAYPENCDNYFEDLESYTFYVVKPGDTIMGISKSFHGTGSGLKYQNLMKDNGLKENSVLETGRILVIRK